ncbi:hypothetical protein PBY51_003247 [Eleginops maclovinus]|uniref:Uncharacterized protein n=1 Tax=Eleginops maclovinus TaxID=56733 RepID=A0AAN7XEF3_ELEMC|nr:hypothetical protein PBY51_003247 [Eleginops maclovinus]
MAPPMTNISEYTLASSHTKQSRLGGGVSPTCTCALALPPCPSPPTGFPFLLVTADVSLLPPRLNANLFKYL